MNSDMESIDHRVKEFKQRYGIHHVIAFSGGASTELPGVDPEDPLHRQYKDVQERRERKIVHDALSFLRHYHIAILTGGTVYGVPKTATQVALEMGMRTIGVYPACAKEGKDRVLPDLHLPIEVGSSYGPSHWGDESVVFTKLLDAVIVIGGGAGTLVEVSHILKMNERLQSNGHKVKLIVPIHGTGGVADGLPFVWGKQDIKNACMPPHAVSSGAKAAELIDKHLHLFSID